MKKLVIISAILALGLPLQAKNLNRSGWKWSSSSICAAGTDADIAGLEGICDGNNNTCWHSNYHAQNGTPERSNPHWVQIDRGTDTNEFTGLAYLPRQHTTNTSCIAYYIYLSDKDMSSTPATSASDIISTLGQPTFSGYWNGDETEKYVDFGGSYKSRYILFVNVQSKSSSSAACAEMNLYSGSPSSSGDSGNPESDEFNALRITPYGADATPHRIAIQGDKLTVSVVHGYVRLGNEDITVEYPMDDVARFSFDYYEFGESSYNGDKKDIYTSRFTPTVKPAAGELKTLDEVNIVINASRKHRINPDTDKPITIMRGSETVLSIMPDVLADFAGEKGYNFTNLGFTTPGTYTLEIPVEMFLCADGTRSNNVERQWTISESSGLNDINATDIPTLAFARRGNILYVSGIVGADTVHLFNAAGQCVASAPVNTFGEAEINVGSMVKGVYFLKLNDITLKIIL